MPGFSPIALASASMSEEEKEKKKKDKKKGAAKTTPSRKPSNASSKAAETELLGAAIQGGGLGQTAGAGVGSLFGPVGTIAGSAIGGAVDANQKEEDPNRPERRRLTKAQGLAQDTKSKKQRALATLSQAVFDWASALR